MAKPLQNISVQAPGFLGLNTQYSSATLDEGFATTAENCIIDQYGRLGARKGWAYSHTPNPAIVLQGGKEFVEIDGTRSVLAWCETSFYLFNGTTLTTLTNTSVSTPDPIGPNNYIAASLNDNIFFFERGKTPLYYNSTNNDIRDTTNVPNGNCALSAYGRLWVADTASDKMTLFWSDLLDGHNFTTGTSGSLDLSYILVDGADQIVALGAHAGRLFVFCRNNIIVFQDTDGDTALDPISMRLVEVIKGVGTPIRDSVQNIGNDLLFATDYGILSVGRLIQEKSQPLAELSKNIRDELESEFRNSNFDKIRTVYSPEEAIYIVLLPDFSECYVFDLRQLMPDGSARATSWEDQTQTSMFTFDNNLYFTQAEGIGQYGGSTGLVYLDNNVPYTFKYYTNFLDFGDPANLKYVKRMACTILTPNVQTLNFKVGYNYTIEADEFYTTPVTVRQGPIIAYGDSTYGTGTYAYKEFIKTFRAPMQGGGNIVQAGFETEIVGSNFSIQRIDIYVKQGRVY